ncbi:putative UDP-glucuronate:xylan alpha-glucuronosyltransferase 3, partial [Cucurbita argyrosperma subsp. sororia]
MAGSTRDLVTLVDKSISSYHKSGLLEPAGWKNKDNGKNQESKSRERCIQRVELQQVQAMVANRLIRNARDLHNRKQWPPLQLRSNAHKAIKLHIPTPNGSYQRIRILQWRETSHGCASEITTATGMCKRCCASTMVEGPHQMPELLQQFFLLRSKQEAQQEWDRIQAEIGKYSDGHWRIKGAIVGDRLTIPSDRQHSSHKLFFLSPTRYFPMWDGLLTHNSPSSTASWAAPSSTASWSAPSPTASWTPPSSTASWSAPSPTASWTPPSSTASWISQDLAMAMPRTS